MSEKEFPAGLFAKSPGENAPDFVKAKLSIKRKDLGNWLRGKDDEWLNFDVKESREGKWYVELDTWKPDKDKATQAVEESREFLDDDLPF